MTTVEQAAGGSGQRFGFSGTCAQTTQRAMTRILLAASRSADDLGRCTGATVLRQLAAIIAAGSGRLDAAAIRYDEMADAAATLKYLDGDLIAEFDEIIVECGAPAGEVKSGLLMVIAMLSQGVAVLAERDGGER